MWHPDIRDIQDKMPGVLKNKKGFSLIEAILTITLLSLGLAGGLTLFQNSTDNSLMKDNRVIASQLASEKLESIILDKTFQGYDFIDETNYPDEDLADPFDAFSRSVIIEEVQAADLTTPEVGSGYKRIDVQVTWGVEGYQTITVSTVLTDYTG
ncbi:MAG: prepilin-type N-terminal cleavage/methylation domain-containing protein [Deltaproteobacteria bacterium]|nr:prepilin-type N-terminal cleavage/methylation domain-containing protein [Deltaproteobacteria bacterium]